MSSNEYGMPVPDEETPLPWKVERDERITDRCGCRVEADCCNGFPETLHFITHAANNIIPAREIVRQLAVSKGVSDLLEIAADAEKLWAKMQEEAGDAT